MIRQPVSISLLTYTTVLEWENLGEPHSTLIGSAMWFPPDEKQGRDSRVKAELREQGLLNGDRISDAFLDAMYVMQRAAVEYYTLAHIEGERVNIRTAMIGRDALLATSQGGRVDIQPIPHDQLAVRLAAALPTVPAARLHSATCPLDDLVAVSKDKAPPSSNNTRDAKRIFRMLEKDPISRGPLHVAIRDGMSDRRSTGKPHPMWFDTEQGRALFSHDGRGWVNLVPGNLQAITGMISTLEDGLRGRRR